tara:strand:+ start:4264 stop:4752 length:489 start_codon:yes stop_codon:yes gene_type:complete
MNTSIYDFSCEDSSGNEVNLSDFQGKTLLIVNTASKCGFTPQYDGLQSLQEKYDSDKFSVLGFPCNQFGGQEPGTDNEIQEFCTLNFSTTFPIFSKIDVNGDNAHPLYEFLCSAKKGMLGSEKIKWNFTKFLINRNGEPVARYAPTTTPDKISKDIEKLIID